MARTDTLGHFLTDVADAIRTKAGTSESIQASTFDTAISNIPSGGSLDDYFLDELTVNTQNSMRQLIKKMKSPITLASNVNSLRQAFNGFIGLVEAPYIDTKNVTDFFQMFTACNNLVSVPQYDLSSATNLSYMFNGCNNLSDESLNNILAMCIGATSYTGSKTLGDLGIGGSAYTARIPLLSNYQDFIDAGWTIS